MRKARLSMLKADYSREFENLTILKSEVIKAIKGESSFSADTLSELIAESEKECSSLLGLVADAERDVADGESVADFIIGIMEEHRSHNGISFFRSNIHLLFYVRAKLFTK